MCGWSALGIRLEEVSIPYTYTQVVGFLIPRVQGSLYPGLRVHLNPGSRVPLYPGFRVQRLGVWARVQSFGFGVHPCLEFVAHDANSPGLGGAVSFSSSGDVEWGTVSAQGVMAALEEVSIPYTYTQGVGFLIPRVQGSGFRGQG